VTSEKETDEATIEIVETDVAVISGNPSSEELAALTAVLAEVLEELAAEQGRRESAATSAWARSQRGVRATITPGAGAWRSFSG
jgi:aryl-alcohol dehydrogenase-like predicted oxidoreductase